MAIASALTQVPRCGRNGATRGYSEMERDERRPPSRLIAAYYLAQAEKLARLPHQERGGWHAFRRGWQARKALPVQDVMSAGGWRDVKALQSAYQGADPDTIRRVVDLEETGS